MVLFSQLRELRRARESLQRALAAAEDARRMAAERADAEAGTRAEERERAEREGAGAAQALEVRAGGRACVRISAVQLTIAIPATSAMSAHTVQL